MVAAVPRTIKCKGLLLADFPLSRMYAYVANGRRRLRGGH
jgi:hypothetical protein